MDEPILPPKLDVDLHLHRPRTGVFTCKNISLTNIWIWIGSPYASYSPQEIHMRCEVKCLLMVNISHRANGIQDQDPFMTKSRTLVFSSQPSTGMKPFWRGSNSMTDWIRRAIILVKIFKRKLLIMIGLSSPELMDVFFFVINPVLADNKTSERQPFHRNMVRFFVVNCQGSVLNILSLTLSDPKAEELLS